MNRLMATLALCACTFLLWAEETPTLTVAPSDQVKYPDAKELLNPSSPNSKAPASATKSGLANAANSPASSVASTAGSTKLHGWFLVWNLQGDQSAAQAWVTDLGQLIRPLVPSVTVVNDGLWKVEAGPLDATTLALAWVLPGSRPVLVKK